MVESITFHGQEVVEVVMLHVTKLHTCKSNVEPTAPSYLLSGTWNEIKYRIMPIFIAISNPLQLWIEVNAWHMGQYNVLFLQHLSSLLEIDSILNANTVQNKSWSIMIEASSSLEAFEGTSLARRYTRDELRLWVPSVLIVKPKPKCLRDPFDSGSQNCWTESISERWSGRSYAVGTILDAERRSIVLSF